MKHRTYGHVQLALVLLTSGPGMSPMTSVENWLWSRVLVCSHPRQVLRRIYEYKIRKFRNSLSMINLVLVQKRPEASMSDRPYWNHCPVQFKFEGPCVYWYIQSCKYQNMQDSFLSLYFLLFCELIRPRPVVLGWWGTLLFPFITCTKCPRLPTCAVGRLSNSSPYGLEKVTEGLQSEGATGKADFFASSTISTFSWTLRTQRSRGSRC